MRRFAGILLVVISAASFGTLGILVRYAYADGMDAISIMFLRFSLSGLLLVALLAARRQPLPRGTALLQLVGMGAIGYVGQAFSYMSALHYISPGLVALLLYLYPAFVAALAALTLREPMTRARLLALGLALAGTALTVGPTSSVDRQPGQAGGQWPGILLAISAAAIYSVYILVGTRVVRQVSAVQSSTVIFAAAGAMSGLLLAVRGPHLPASGAGWLSIALLVLVATVIPVVTFLAGLERIGPTNAATLSTLEPLVTVALAALLLGETLPPIAVLGGALILAAGLVLTRGELRRAG